MHDLEVPDDFAGGGSQRDYRIGVVVATFALAAVEVRARAAGGNEDETALRINRNDRPRVGCASLSRTVSRPGLSRGVVGSFRYRVPTPRDFAGSCVVGPHDPSLELNAAIVADGRTDDYQVADDRRRRGNFIVASVDQSNVVRQINLSAFSEIIAQSASRRVESYETRIDRGDVNAPLSRPAIRPARNSTTGDFRVTRHQIDFRVVAPALGSLLRIEGNHAIEGGAQVEYAVYDDRCGFECGVAHGPAFYASGSGPISPSDFQVLDVVAVDLRKRRVARASWIAPIGRPFSVTGWVILCGDEIQVEQ